MRGGTAGHIHRHLALLLSTYPSLSPWNVYDLELETLNDLIEAAQRGRGSG